MTRLHDLYEAGQSVWLDFIKRDMLDDGRLDQLVADGVRGLTSNPTIFQQAIAGSDLYDAQIVEVLESQPGAAASKVFEELAIRDIRDAADALQAVYADSGGSDGFVSLEVSPHLAHDTGGTIAEAKRLWSLVDRPNLMIKVPATPAGVPAIEALTAAGISVNSTLMFSLDNYVAVATAYVRGLEECAHPATVASVASFFVSRVDSKADNALEKVGSEDAMALRGKIAIANAKLAYRHYGQIFGPDAFGDLAAAGARPQRALWASTSTKNPEYPDVLYVDELIGPNTVNTLPPATLDAFVDHGTIDAGALTNGIDIAERQMSTLAELGIDYVQLTDELQDEGVAAFADSFDDLLATIGDKMALLGA